MSVLRRNSNDLTENDRLCHEVCRFINGWDQCPCSQASARPCSRIETQVAYIAAKVREMDEAAAKAARAERRKARAA